MLTKCAPAKNRGYGFTKRFTRSTWSFGSTFLGSTIMPLIMALPRAIGIPIIFYFVENEDASPSIPMEPLRGTIDSIVFSRATIQ